ncbi:MAG: prolyl oligopeptidase family serine peptidase [Flavobacteriales bacterium]|jgi:predicted peptidase
MKKLSVIFFLCCFGMISTAKAQLKPIYSQADYAFWLHLPADSILKAKPPVLIFLHGKSLSGTDLARVKRYGVISEIEKGRKIPAVVVAPQTSNGWDPIKVMSVLSFVKKNFDVDTNRVYVVGMSMGGYGTLNFAGKYPEQVAAAVALCGGGNIKDGCNLATVPLWIQHGTLDEAVPISESEKIVRAIKNCNGGENLKYTALKGADHGDLEKMFRTDELYDWLFQFTKEVQE